MKPKVGKGYRIYGKMGDMKVFRPIGGDRFAINLFYADMFFPKSKEECDKLEKYVNELSTVNCGQFHLRKIERKAHV